MKKNKLIIGLFGFGVVGEGIYQILQKTPSLNAEIRKICIKHPAKKRNAPAELFTTSFEELLNYKEINVIVELIDDASASYLIVSNALRKKKAVVSANKKMIAENLEELLKYQAIYKVPFLYEAAVCGSIPVIRNLEEYYDNDLLEGICGIVNGSTNFILTRMSEDRQDYEMALSKAQQLGFAESNPTLDVEGIDAVNKLTILLLHGYGIITHPEKLINIGINRLHAYDSTLALQKNYQIRLTAQARKLKNGHIAAFVLPQFVTQESQLFSVRNEFNGVVLQSSFADKQFLYGKGAGRYPTSSAVLSDISALRYNYRYEYRKQQGENAGELTDNFYLNIYVSFENWNDINKNDFEWIDEFRCNSERHYLIGVIGFVQLKKSNWYANKQVSVIVCPDGIIEDISYREVQKKSFALAGSKFIDNTKLAMEDLDLNPANS